MTENNSNEENLPSISTPFFAVSIKKLVVMSVATGGIYEIYWFYKNWKLIKARDSSNISPVWRSMFGYFFCYQCFSRVRKFGQENGITGDLDAGLWAIGWIVAELLSGLPVPYFLLSFLSIWFLLPVQEYVNKINSEISPAHDQNSNLSKWNWLAIIVGGVLLLIVVLGSIVGKQHTLNL